MQRENKCMKKVIWFKAKKYGWGWSPATWQGWLITLIFVGIVSYRGLVVQEMFDTATSFVWRYVFETLLLTIILIGICFVTGEKPRWRWGDKT